MIVHRSDGAYESTCRNFSAHRIVGVWPEGDPDYQFAIDPRHPGLDRELASRQR